ncbi:hypothetical protein HYV83_00710 [Candidatus Woesearchaeota archaeon]|nr:hypothetical protein [Candidatus Woesearchaeota archaeon]
MVFIRIKRISGKEYGYLVANSWTGSGPRQKVSKYLGRLIRPEKAKSEPLAQFLGLAGEPAITEWVKKSSFKEIAAALIKWELNNHNIAESSYGISAEKAELLDCKGKPVAIALNDGFLCGHTAKKLLEYDAAADYSGYNLADALTAAGIAIEKEVFITLFGKMQAMTGAGKQEAAAKETLKDFYY